MKIVFLGATKFSIRLMECLYGGGLSIESVYTTDKEIVLPKSKIRINNLNHADISSVPFLENAKISYVDESSPLSSFKDEIIVAEPDVIIAAGWYHMVPGVIRDIPKYGVWGIHASMLPKYAGWSPLTWAIINGEKKAGVTIFRMDESIDGGDVVDQSEFEIAYEDDIESVYEKATVVSCELLIKSVSGIENIKLRKQNMDELEVYPRRTPEDGEIDLNLSAEDMYNFIRAQSPPYPGAFIRTRDGKKLIVEKARVED